MDRHGHATIALAPGTYHVAAPANSDLPRLATMTLNGHAVPRLDGGYRINVGAARVEKLELDLDTGIR